jgi:saccharopine dehydrogenase-like NADP-dependent oxidoreductase
MKKVIVLGAGLVGKPMAIDLARDFEVTVADISRHRLDKIPDLPNLKKTEADLSNQETLIKLISDRDIVLNALPGDLGFNALKTVINQAKNIVDIAFFPEEPAELDTLARERNITAIMDCGVAPGMSNILIGYVNEKLDSIDNAVIYVGGLPKIRQWPWEYKAVFSPADVIEEYTRPARYVENCQLVIREALSDPEYLEFDGVGTLEAFNSDGLRSLIHTISAPNMKEKTLRFPGHIEKIAVMRASGFFSKDPIEFNGHLIRPLDFTSKLLFPNWELKPGEEDITVMRVEVSGMKNGKKISYRYDLFDSYDAVSQTHSMARTTGYTATMAVRMLANGLYSDKGLIYPEFIGRHNNCVSFILDGLKERGVIYKETIS